VSHSLKPRYRRAEHCSDVLSLTPILAFALLIKNSLDYDVLFVILMLMIMDGPTIDCHTIHHCCFVSCLLYHISSHFVCLGFCVPFMQEIHYHSIWSYGHCFFWACSLEDLLFFHMFNGLSLVEYIMWELLRSTCCVPWFQWPLKIFSFLLVHQIWGECQKKYYSFFTGELTVKMLKTLLGSPPWPWSAFWFFLTWCETGLGGIKSDD
jgi:hypothetical protein